MSSRHALVKRIDRRDTRIAVSDLMPPEKFYRPNRTVDGSIVGTFFFVFATVFALLWLSASIVPVFLIMTAYFARTFVQRATHSAAVQQNQAAVNLLNAGRVNEAAQIFDQLSRSEQNTPAHAVYVFNRAVAYTLQGRPKRAYSLFNAILRSHAFHFGFSAGYLPLLYIEVGTCLALMGDLSAARRHRDEAAKAMQAQDAGRLVFLDVLLLVREGEYVAASELATTRYREAESTLRVPTLKALRLVHAFALAKMGHRGSARFNTLVQGVRPARRGEFGWVGAEWLPFRAFLAEVGL